MIIPQDIQFGLLKRKVGSSVAQKVRDDCDKKYAELHVIGTHEHISCFGWARRTKGPLYLAINAANGGIIEENYGEIENRKSNMPLWFGIPLYTLSIVGLPFLPSYLNDQLSPSRCAARKNSNRLYDLHECLETENISEVKRLAASIEVYLESSKQLSERLKRKVEIVELEKPENFLYSDNLDFLKTRAVLLGANAIASYTDTPERCQYGYWTSDRGETSASAEYWKTSSYIVHTHLGIPVRIGDML